MAGDAVTRFAPSPTGLLHKGHAVSALTAWTAAREAGGRFLLRIEDTDFTRCRPEYTEAVFEDLAWLGLDWETPVRRQSDHRAEYDRALETLREQGLLYRCFRTRKERLALAGVAIMVATLLLASVAVFEADDVTLVAHHTPNREFARAGEHLVQLIGAPVGNGQETSSSHRSSLGDAAITEPTASRLRLRR